MDNRDDKIKNILDRKEFFKFICGASNENLVEIRRSTTVYTLAGATAIDVSANVEAINAAQDGIAIAKNIAVMYNRSIPFTPIIIVSVNAGDDLHFRKAVINPAICKLCGICLEICNQNAIRENLNTCEFYVLTRWCIGCGGCIKRCPILGAITFVNPSYSLPSVLSRCIEAGAEAIELHASIQDDLAVINSWKTIVSYPSILRVSLCLDRSLLSEEQFITRINECHCIAGDRMVVQADGNPISGDEDDYHTTLQAIATADIVFKNKISIPIIASGGTNSRTKEFADLCGVPINGIAVGSYARKIIRHYITSNKFDEDMDFVMQAVAIAEKLVKEVKLCKE